MNPCYEEYYEQEIPVGTPSPSAAGWVFPALFRSGDVWLLVSESGLSRNYCGGRLRSESPDGEYTIGFPDPRESFQDGAVHPESTLPWQTPWRLIVVGSLKTVAESMLGVDLADPPASTAATAADVAHLPGKSSWSWPLLGDGQTICETQKNVSSTTHTRWAGSIASSTRSGTSKSATRNWPSWSNTPAART